MLLCNFRDKDAQEHDAPGAFLFLYRGAVGHTTVKDDESSPGGRLIDTSSEQTAGCTREGESPGSIRQLKGGLRMSTSRMIPGHRGDCM